MALIKCPECGRDVSDKATSCPHCGNPINQQVKESYRKAKNKWVLPVSISILLIFGIGAVLLFLNSEKHSDLTIIEDRQEKTADVVDSVRLLHITDFIEMGTIDCCGIPQKDPIYISDKYVDETETETIDMVEYLKKLGFKVIHQDTKTFEGEGGEPYQATITNLKQEGENGCEIETDGHKVNITFKNSSQGESFIKEATDMGFRNIGEYNGWTSYSWFFKCDDGNEPEDDVFIERKDNQVSITSGYEL